MGAGAVVEPSALFSSAFSFSSSLGVGDRWMVTNAIAENNGCTPIKMKLFAPGAVCNDESPVELHSTKQRRLEQNAKHFAAAPTAQII